MISITLDNFQSAVIDASNTTPVLLDLGSPRSPVSQTLTTTLIRLEIEFGGAFSLASANCDLVPQVAQAFRVTAIPTCVLLINGQPVDGFTGDLSEEKVRDFLKLHVQPQAAEAKLPPELILLQAAQQSVVEQDTSGAIKHCKAALDVNPEFAIARLMLAQLFLQLQPALAQQQCDAIEQSHAAYASLDAAQLDDLNTLKQTIAEQLAHLQNALNTPEVAAFNAAITLNTKDLTARLDLAKAYQAAQAFELAVEQLLFIVQTDRSFGDDVGRKTLLEIFNQASETPQQVRQWRQKLSAALN
jgi:putative thioredoxin